MANAFTPEQIAQILEEFFKTVGARQYIGARYVPIFGRKDEESIEWDNTKPYEPLTIVLYQGNSYTSRQYVPAGVQITNNEFWAVTGNYNAQIEEYRRETARALQAAQNAQGDIDTLLPKTDFSAENTVKDAIDSVQNDIDVLLPKSAFSAEKTVKDYVDQLGTDIKNNSNFVYVSDYGAVGDGTTDDLQAIQAAIDACAASENQKYLVFEAKEYFISNMITLNNCSFMSFIGNGCIIKHDYKNGVYIRNNCHDISFDNMVFHGQFEPNDTETESNSCIAVGASSNTALYEAYNISITNCKFVAGVFGIAANNVLNLTVANCMFEGCVYRPEDGAGGYAILEQSCVNVLIKNCFFKIGDYGRHDIYVSVLQPKTANRESKNVKILNCFSDRSEMRTQSSGAFFSTTTVRIAVRACVNLNINGFFAIGGTGIVAINNLDGDLRNIEIENVLQTNAVYISGSVAPNESRSAVGILGAASDSNYIEVSINNLKIVNAATNYLDVSGEADIIKIENMVINYRVEINTSVKDTYLILNNVGLKSIGGLQYTGTSVLHGKFTNFYNASGSASMAGGACSNDQGKIDVECYELTAKVCRVLGSGTFEWLNNALVHPVASVDASANDYRVLNLRYCTKPSAGNVAPFGSGITGFYNFDTTHDADSTSARIYTYDADGTVNKAKNVIVSVY